MKPGWTLVLIGIGAIVLVAAVRAKHGTIIPSSHMAAVPTPAVLPPGASTSSLGSQNNSFIPPAGTVPGVHQPLSFFPNDATPTGWY